MKNKSELGKYLKLARLGQNLSLKKAGGKLGYPNGQFIWNWENGKSFPPFSKLNKLSKVYNISLPRLKYIMYLEELAEIKKRYGIGDI